jgi:hypothetical protein
MEAIVLLILPTLILVAAVVMGFAFLREAFTVPRGLATTARSELPLLRGDELRHWAADRSKSIVAKYMKRPWTRATAAAAAREVEQQVSRIVDDVSVLPTTGRSRSSVCTERGDEPISLTVPEALAVAEEVRSNLPPARARRVLNAARANLEASTGSTTATTGDGACLCPLLGDDGHCLVFSARPLHCRGCASEPSRQTAEATQFAVTVSEGMRQGLCEALVAAGLDGHCYELNRSLVDALDEV